MDSLAEEGFECDLNAKMMKVIPHQITIEDVSIC